MWIPVCYIPYFYAQVYIILKPQVCQHVAEKCLFCPGQPTCLDYYEYRPEILKYKDSENSENSSDLVFLYIINVQMKICIVSLANLHIRNSFVKDEMKSSMHLLSLLISRSLLSNSERRKSNRMSRERAQDKACTYKERAQGCSAT